MAHPVYSLSILVFQNSARRPSPARMGEPAQMMVLSVFVPLATLETSAETVIFVFKDIRKA